MSSLRPTNNLNPADNTIHIVHPTAAAPFDARYETKDGYCPPPVPTTFERPVYPPLYSGLVPPGYLANRDHAWRNALAGKRISLIWFMELTLSQTSVISAAGLCLPTTMHQNHVVVSLPLHVPLFSRIPSPTQSNIALVTTYYNMLMVI